MITISTYSQEIDKAANSILDVVKEKTKINIKKKTRKDLLKEMQEAGLEVDLNKVL